MFFNFIPIFLMKHKTPIPTFPQGGRRRTKLFPLGGNGKGGSVTKLETGKGMNLLKCEYLSISILTHFVFF